MWVQGKLLSEGICLFSGYHFHLFFLEQGIYQKKGNFSGAHYQNMSNGEILLELLEVLKFLCFGVYLLPIFFLNRVPFEGKNFGAR